MKKSALFFANRFSFVAMGFDEPGLSLREGGETYNTCCRNQPKARVL
jgi:hypothetical protein